MNRTRKPTSRPRQATAQAKPHALSAAEDALLRRCHLVAEDLLWSMLMADPVEQEAFQAFLEERGFFRYLREKNGDRPHHE